MRNAILTCSLFALMAAAASAAVIDQNTGGTSGTKTEFFGQSFTTPASGIFNNLQFSFYSDIPPVTPSAGGTAYLLTQVYTGTPSALSLATPGLLAASTSVSGGAFIFAPGVTLAPNTKYFLYENAVITASGGNAFAGGEAYFALDSGASFGTAQTLDLTGLQSANFVLSSAAASVPEPASWILLGAGLMAFGLKRRKQSA